jgi:hypothetical protein
MDYRRVHATPLKKNPGAPRATPYGQSRVFFCWVQKMLGRIGAIPKVVARQHNSRLRYCRKPLWDNVVTRAKKGVSPARKGEQPHDAGGVPEESAPVRTAGEELRAELGGKGDPVMALIRQRRLAGAL